MNKTLLVSMLVLGTTLNVNAADFTVDADHSFAGFSIRHLVANFKGELKNLEGTFSFDEKKGADSLKASVKGLVKSIDTHNEKRNAHLQSPDFFDAEKTPTISFVSKSAKAAGKNKFKLTGDFTMRGVTKPVTFDVEYLGAASDPWGNGKNGFVAKAKINRKDYGVSWNKGLDKGGVVLSEAVDLEINIEGTEIKAEKPADKK